MIFSRTPTHTHHAHKLFAPTIEIANYEKFKKCFVEKCIQCSSFVSKTKHRTDLDHPEDKEDDGLQIVRPKTIKRLVSRNTLENLADEVPAMDPNGNPLEPIEVSVLRGKPFFFGYAFSLEVNLFETFFWS